MHISHAVRTYIDSKINQLSEQKEYDEELQGKIIEHLYSNAEDTFLWVALVWKELEKVESWETEDILTEFSSGLPSLYNRMMDQIRKHNKRTAEFCLKTLSAVVLAFRPLSFQEVITVAGLPEKGFQKHQALIKLIDYCGSFLTYREDTVFFIHQSAKDYLTDPKQPYSFSESELGHQNLALRLLRAQHILKKDICEIKDYGPVRDGIKLDTLESIKYASIFWIDHFCASQKTDEDDLLFVDDGEIHQFFLKHFLHWLEILSILDRVFDAVLLVRKLRNRILVCRIDIRN